MERRHLSLGEHLSIILYLVTLITVISSMFFWFHRTNELPARVTNNEKRLDKLEAQMIENNTKTDLIYSGVLEIRSVLLHTK